MRVLFISSKNMIAADLARVMKVAGHSVRLFIDDPMRRSDLDGLVPKTMNWRNDLKWVGKNGLIVFDDSGYGSIQDDLRKKGYSVFGGCKLADRLEFDRQYCQAVFKSCGLQTLETVDFNNIESCIDFVRGSKKTWVIKQNNHKLNVNYVSVLKDNADTVNMLKHLRKNYSHKIKTVTIQERVRGVEVGVGRYFNGENWVGPIEINFEHKRLFDGDIGPMTTEMGTLAWYDSNEANVLYARTLAKMLPFLREIGFRGDFEINFIINRNGVFPLEATPRLGSPIIYLQSEIQKTDWAYFLKAVADGRSIDVKYRTGYGLVVLLATPPFPYFFPNAAYSCRGLDVYVHRLNKQDRSHLFFEGVAQHKGSSRAERFYISDSEGYTLYVTGVGKSVQSAREKVYNILSKVDVPKGFYRSDIGLKFIQGEYAKLRKWHYI